MVSQVIVACYTTGSIAVVLFGIFACVWTFMRHRKYGSDNTEFFLTARRSVGWFIIAWSFYAAAMGSWALFSPPSYAYYAGILGLTAYSVASGFPILVVAFLGSKIHELVPDICSFTDYVYRRFGPIAQIYVSMLMLLNMGVALTAEFTAVGDLFNIVIGAVRWPIVVIIALVSTIYTSYGGLHVSIITDQVQAFTSLLMVLVLFIFVAATFRAPLPTPLPENLRPNFYGYSAIAVMPISLVSATIFSEAMWQRCWATATKKQLRVGALIGSIAVSCVVFLFGFGGVLANWSGLFVPAGPNDYGNTILFSLLDNVNGGRHTIITIVVAVLAVTMSTSAVDSLQNALVDTISGVYLKNVNLLWTRLLVLILTVPCLVVSLRSYNIIQLFLVANLFCTTSVVPVLAGMWHSPRGLMLVTPFSMLMGCVQGLASIFWWSKLDQHYSLGETYGQAVKRIITVEYQYQSFLITLGMSVVGIIVGAALEWLYRKLAKQPYNLTDPFVQRDVMPVDAKAAVDVMADMDMKAAK